MSTVTNPSELIPIINDLKHRLLGANVTGVHVAPQSTGVVVGGYLLDQQTTSAVRRCCDEVSHQYGIPVAVCGAIT